jgi:hypothetical protein
MFYHAILVTRIVLRIEEIGLAPGFVREVVEVWDAWEGRKSTPLKLQQLMLNLRIDVNRLYKIGVRPQEKPKTPQFKDVRLDRIRYP